MGMERVSVCFEGLSRKHSLVEIWKELEITPSCGSHSMKDTYRRGHNEFTYNETLFQVDSGEPESAPLETHLEKLAARMRETGHQPKQLFDDSTLRVAHISSHVQTCVELDPKCVSLVKQLGVGLTLSFQIQMDRDETEES